MDFSLIFLMCQNEYGVSVSWFLLRFMQGYSNYLPCDVQNHNFTHLTQIAHFHSSVFTFSVSLFVLCLRSNYCAPLQLQPFSMSSLLSTALCCTDDNRSQIQSVNSRAEKQTSNQTNKKRLGSAPILESFHAWLIKMFIKRQEVAPMNKS